MRLTDWLGNEYGAGDTIIYPVMASRSIEMQQATVLDIWTVYQCPEDYKWKRLKEGEPVPTKEEFYWERTGDIPLRVSKGHKPVDTELRVRLQPDGKGSRGFHTRIDSNTVWIAPDGTEMSFDKMHRKLEAEHGPYRSQPVWNARTYRYEGEHKSNWEHEDFGYVRRVDAIKPKPVTLTLGIDNITLLHNSPENLEQMEIEDAGRRHKKFLAEKERRAKETLCELPTGSGEYCCRRIEHDEECSHKISMTGI